MWFSFYYATSSISSLVRIWKTCHCIFSSFKALASYNIGSILSSRNQLDYAPFSHLQYSHYMVLNWLKQNKFLTSILLIIIWISHQDKVKVKSRSLHAFLELQRWTYTNGQSILLNILILILGYLDCRGLIDFKPKGAY